MVDKMSCSHLLVMFVLLNFITNIIAAKDFDEMNWTDPTDVYGPLNILWDRRTPPRQRHMLITLNLPNKNREEKTFIATGILLDSSRILTSYNPFKELVKDPLLSSKIVVVLPTGAKDNYSVVKIIEGIVCAREVVYTPPDEKHFWHGKRDSPLHDLMILRMTEEIGDAFNSYKDSSHGMRNTITYMWVGHFRKITYDNVNALRTLIAKPEDKFDGPIITICSLNFRNKKELKNYTNLVQTDYEHATIVDCEEWLPRQWGYFLCVRNIDNFSGLASGATLISGYKLFGIGSFTLWKNDIGILVFTDVRPYGHLIKYVCSDDEDN